MKRSGGVRAADGLDHRADVALEVAAVLLAERFETDHVHARHLGRWPPAVDFLPERIAPVLRHHRHVVPERDQFAQEVQRVDAHP